MTEHCIYFIFVHINVYIYMYALDCFSKFLITFFYKILRLGLNFQYLDQEFYGKNHDPNVALFFSKNIKTSLKQDTSMRYSTYSIGLTYRSTIYHLILR